MSDSQSHTPILDLFRRDDQDAVITGAGRGIGEGIALAMAEAGADIVLAARRGDEIEAVADKVRGLGRKALAVTTDVMHIELVQALAKSANDEFGKLSCWVSNAGGADDRVPRTLLEMPERQWDFQLNLNLKAVWTGAQAAAEIMNENGGGTIINISSAAAYDAAPQNGPYAVAKAGVNNLTQTLAVELARYGIRVNGISPGPIPTEVFMEFLDLDESQLPGVAKRLNIPLRRLGTPEDVAAGVIYLASQASSWITGQTIVVKGGP
jgi:NAD(P)-dependent dehydrogenase (short-subunit alcohol dehydrogenase family)